MNQGYVKLWRKSLDGGWLHNPSLWTFWCWCLMKASHKEYDLVVGCQQVHLMPGDFIFGRKVASDTLKMSEQIIRTNIEFLKSCKNLTIKKTNKFSIISIVNWDAYQSQEIEDNQQINQQLTNKQPATNQQLTTNKNVKNVKKVFTKPSLEEVRTYCLERRNNIDPETWLHHYESNGWMVGKNKMQNWKSTIITWEKRNEGTNASVVSNARPWIRQPGEALSGEAQRELENVKRLEREWQLKQAAANNPGKDAK